MIRAAFHKGARAAVDRFGIREASLTDLLLGLATPALGRAAYNVFVPPETRARAAKAVEAPFQAAKAAPGLLMRGVRRAISGPSSPADALAQALSGSPGAAATHAPTAAIGRLLAEVEHGVPR